jgi:hypothetical protein
MPWPIGSVPPDPECLPLIALLNELPGIDTVASCSGHGEKAFWISFEAHSVRNVAPVSWALLGQSAASTTDDRWHLLIVFGQFGSPMPWYVLEGPTDDEAGRAQIACNLRRILDEGIEACFERFVSQYIADAVGHGIDVTTAREMARRGSAVTAYEGKPVQPDYDEHGVGYCNDKCPSFDGKRCDVTGNQPRSYLLCYPWAESSAKRGL